MKVASQAFTWKVSICLAKIDHVFRCSLSGELTTGRARLRTAFRGAASQLQLSTEPKRAARCLARALCAGLKVWAEKFAWARNPTRYACTFENVAESALKACCLVKDAQGRSCCEPLRGWFWSIFYFVSWFFRTEYASLSKYLSKIVQVVIQVVNNKKVMAKTPREANLYGNWCVRKGLNFKSQLDISTHTCVYDNILQGQNLPDLERDHFSLCTPLHDLSAVFFLSAMYAMTAYWWVRTKIVNRLALKTFLGLSIVLWKYMTGIWLEMDSII